MKKKYPFFIIPKLSEKNIITKFLNDKEFFDKRRRQLEYFINYIFTHCKLKDCREFYKFLSDPEFDEEFFKTDENFYLFPEAEKLSEGITKKLYNVFSSFSNYFTYHLSPKR